MYISFLNVFKLRTINVTNGETTVCINMNKGTAHLVENTQYVRHFEIRNFVKPPVQK